MGKQAILVVVTAQYIAQGPAGSSQGDQGRSGRGAAAEATASSCGDGGGNS